MRETRTSSSEGGGGESTVSPSPYVRQRACMVWEVQVLPRHALSGL